MKKWFIFLVTGVLMLGLAQFVYAGTATLAITASVPSANDVGFFVSRVTGVAPNVVFATPILGSQTLDFGTLTFAPGPGIFLSDHFYAIDVGAVNTATTPPSPAAGLVGTVSVTYVDGLVRGIGNKAIATYVKVTGAPGSQTEAIFARHTLLASNGGNISPTSFSGGFLRIYVGINTGEIFAQFPVETTGSPFTTGDAPGQYTGTLTLSSTLQ